MRKVKVFRWERQATGKYKKEVRDVAKFHQFGFSYDETDLGVGTFSTALIEWDDGTMGNVDVELVQFID